MSNNVNINGIDELDLTFDGNTTVSTSNGVTSITNQTTEPVNPQTGATYTVQGSDRRKLVTFSNSSPVAVTLPQADSVTFFNGWFADFINEGAGAVTITPTTSTIDGKTSINLARYQGVRIVSDGINYFTVRGAQLAQIVFVLNSGATASVAAWALVPRRSSTITTIKFLTITSDATTDLTFDVKKNGTTVLTAPITITHGTAANTVTTSTAFTSSPLSLSQDDVVTLQITSGTASWTGTLQLE